MKKQMITLAIAAAFALPALAQTSGRTTTDPKDSNPAAPPATLGKDRAAAGATAGSFTTIDRNNDGYISRDEAKDSTWNSRFTELDKDNDNRVSQSEFQAMQSPASGASRSGASTGGSTTGGMGGSVGPGGTQSGSSTSGVGDKPGQKQQ
jgi:hypothetical protein